VRFDPRLSAAQVLVDDIGLRDQRIDVDPPGRAGREEIRPSGSERHR
jgi:hypothetical protein